MSGSNRTGVATPVPETGRSAVEHWAFQVDSPFRGPAEIGELAGRSRGAAMDAALAQGAAGPWAELGEAFGEDLSQWEEEFEAYGEGETYDEAEGFDEAAFAEADLLEETPASEHPLAAVFSLPRLAFDAMAKGGWQVAIAMAIGAGHRDVNKLTNMVFWFRHPTMIGQKIRTDQRDLAREWLDIRDQIVKPALAGAPATTIPSTPPTPSRPSAPTGPPKVGRTSIPPDGLRWFGPPAEETPELMAFMHKVYRAHVRRSQGDFVDTLPGGAIEEVEPGTGKYARKDTAAKAREMLMAARAKLAAEGLTGSVRIGILSAYRSADLQFDIWQGKTTKGKGGFPFYYAQTKSTRQKPKYGGEHSDKAAEYLAGYMGAYVAAPGYSNHQDGLALDLGTRKGKGSLIKLYEGSWFHNWLKVNAGTYQFRPLESEAWHWTYRPTAGSASETWETAETRAIGEAWETGETWPAGEATPTAITAGMLEVPKIPLLASHRGRAPDLILRWNDMPTVPAQIDVVVHLHGYSFATMTLPKNMEVWAGLDLAPVDGASGSGRSRPTLTVLPRGHFTGIQVGKIYRYTFPALTTRDGLTTLINESLQQLAGRVGGLPPKMSRLILTAHSGGGAPLMQILRRHDPHEVHAYDAMYQDPSALAEWASRHIKADVAAVQAGSAPIGAMRVFFRPGTRAFSMRLLDAISADLQSAPAAIQDRYRVEASTLGHWQIPRQYGWRMLSDVAMDVPDARRPAPRRAVNRLFEVDASETPFLGQTFETAEADEAEEYDVAEAETEGALEAPWADVGYEERPEAAEFEDLGEEELEAAFEDGRLETEELGELEPPGETGELEVNELEGDPLALVGTIATETPPGGLDVRTSEVLDLDEELQDLYEEPTVREDFWGWGFGAGVIAPTVGFEFDVHYGIIPAVVTAAGKPMPADGDLLTTHTEATHMFKVKLDGPLPDFPARMEIATKPFTVDDAGRKELEKAIKETAKLAAQLKAGHKGSGGSAVTIPGVAGHPRPFTLSSTVVSGMPLARLWVSGAFKASADSVWASPQATVTVKLSRVPALIRAIKDSEGKGPGVALSGSTGTRAGVRSEAAYRALREVDRMRARLMATRPRLTLTDGTVVDEKSYTPALHGFLVLLAMYFWTTELPYRFEDTAPRNLRDYEPFAKAYLPMNVKAPFPEIFRSLLTDKERMMFRELFADGSARVRLFTLARPAGATLADGGRLLFPTGPKELGLDSVHERQKAEFGTAPTWNDLVSHTIDPTHRSWGERLLVPISRPIPVSRTSPRVALELRRIGFASVDARLWPGLMRSVFKLVHRLDA